jgi:tRNA nucleotidyltransferase/poly(A) polymerase
MKEFKFYEVGGCVRDELLGLKSKDIDYVAVPDDGLLEVITYVDTMFSILETYLRNEGFEIFLITPDCFTIRAKFPKDHKYQGIADFVMARKEVGYIPNTRQPMIVPGTLRDDLIRRDFTLNALAKDEDGNIIDMFDGMWALENKILMTPQDAIKTFDDDALRIIRGVRFSITKGFSMHSDIINAIEHYDYESKMKVVSTERIREELLKCFKFDTLKTLSELNHFPKLRDYVFRNNLLWLKPTTEF